MSIEAMVWALKKAPVSEPLEALILVGLADHADDAGANAYPSQAKLATYGRCSPRTVKRRLQMLEEAGLITRGDQQKVDHLPANRRPIVWDLSLHIVANNETHAEDILGCLPDPADTSDTPDLGVSDGAGVSGGAAWGVTPDTLGGHGWPTNRPLTILEPSISEKPIQRPAMAHPIPADFSLTDDRAAWAKEHTPAVHAQRETDSFVDYWRGNGSKKKDWHGTWRNWMRKAQTDAERRGWKPQQGRPTIHPNYGWIEANR